MDVAAGSRPFGMERAPVGVGGREKFVELFHSFTSMAPTVMAPAFGTDPKRLTEIGATAATAERSFTFLPVDIMYLIYDHLWLDPWSSTRF